MATSNKIKKGLISAALIALLTMIGVHSAQASTDINAVIEELTQGLIHIKKGEVLKTTDTDVYISLGRKHGVAPGNQFEVIRQGEPIKVGDEIVGYEQTKIAEIEVNIEQEKISGCKILDQSEAPQVGDKVRQLRKNIKTLIVGQAEYNKKPVLNQFTRLVQEKLITALASQGKRVVERDRLDKVLEQQKLGYSGLLKIETAKKIGELLNADGIIIGGVSDMGDAVSINIRIVDIETGRMVTAAEAELPKTPNIAKLLDTPYEDPKDIVDTPTTDPEKGEVVQVKKERGFTFELGSCKRQGGNVKCEFFVTSDSDKELTLRGKTYGGSRLFDDFGNIYKANGVSLASCSREDQCEVDLITGIRTKASVSFEGISSDATYAPVVELGCNFKVKFRDVPFN